jgi:UDP-2,3-diacylglucosamine pyrophosphatase LpxH
MSDNGAGRTLRRKLSDDTLLAFLSDSHIGGDAGRDIFESPDDLILLFDDLDRHAGPVELVLAGDFFDFLRVGEVAEGRNRASATISRPEYGALFGSLRRLAAGPNRKVVYLPGNHDAEIWWNRDIRAELQREGLVHDFALSYSATFESAPDRVIYCEHGNEFDTANVIANYDDSLDTPLGYHIVTEIIPRLPSGPTASALDVSEINHVFPLATIPEWMAGRLFYALVTHAVRWLLLPLLVLYVAYEAIAFALGLGGRAINTLFVEVTYDATLLFVAFGLFFFLARRMANHAIGKMPLRLVEGEKIQQLLQRGEEPPLGAVLPAEISVFVYGHTHEPSLTPFDRPSGPGGLIVNSGCWLRQLQPIKAHFHAPTVFASRFVQTHVRITLQDGLVQVQLWEHPRPSSQKLFLVERLAVAGRLAVEPEKGAVPRIAATAAVPET